MTGTGVWVKKMGVDLGGDAEKWVFRTYFEIGSGGFFAKGGFLVFPPLHGNCRLAHENFSIFLHHRPLWASCANCVPIAKLSQNREKNTKGYSLWFFPKNRQKIDFSEKFWDDREWCVDSENGCRSRGRGRKVGFPDLFRNWLTWFFRHGWLFSFSATTRKFEACPGKFVDIPAAEACGSILCGFGGNRKNFSKPPKKYQRL